MRIYEAKAGREGGEEAVEKVWGGGVRGGRHGLKVGPCGLLDETVTNGDFVGGVSGGSGGGGVQRGARDEVFERSVG